jgi:amino acid transporter
MTSLLLVLFLITLLALYFLVIRPWQMTWGATKEETRQAFVGDDIVTKPHFVATRALTIHASPSEVWKWILQIGSSRAGFYSLDWLDNAGVTSSREILPQFQKIEKDFFIPFTPNQKNGMWVKDYQEYEYILWWDKKSNGTWGWYLTQPENGVTRLITRLRTRYDFSFPWILYYLFYDFGDFVMMRKCLLGIKERAEAITQKPQVV